MAKIGPNEPINEITNSTTDRVLTVGTVDGEAQDLNAEANLTFNGSVLAVTGDLTVSGNATISGTTTQISTTNTLIADRLIELGTGASTGADSGIIIERGSTGNNAAILWDESRDEFALGTTTATGASTGDLSFTPGNLSVERLGAGTEQAETEVHAKRDTASGPTYSTTAPIIVEDDARPAIQLVGSANNIGMLQFGDNAAAAAGQVYYDHSTDKLRIDCGGNSDRLTVDANGDLVVARNLDVDGTANLDAVDIDGAVQVGQDDTGYDVTFYGDTASAYVTWDASADDLILAGAARVVVPEGQLVLGSTAITASAAEINVLDGVASLDTDLSSASNADDSIASAKAIATQLATKQATITAGTLLDLSGATVNVDLTEAAAATIAAGDHVLFLDGGATGTHAKGSIDDVATLFAGSAASTGLSASSGVLSVSDLHPVGVDGAANQLITDDGDGTVTSESKLLCNGATTTIGNGTAEDSMLVFDGNAVDFRIGIDDSADVLEIGKGSTHGTTPAIKVDSNVNVQIMHNSAVADGEVSGDLAVFQADEDLSAGEIVYFKSNGKVAKATATAAASSRAIGLCTADTAANAFGAFLLRGFARFNSAFPTWTVGGTIYNPTAEQSGLNVPHQTAPSADGQYLQIVGYSVSADAIWFDPDSTVVEIA